ncbi:MAG: ABC-F family ATP-binding cassette domain-containing protein [Chloroflexi bacterium]|nr:ABC-F family ATP-binding cassette domain-containing protein [Chloroflexota bacterium]
MADTLASEPLPAMELLRVQNVVKDYGHVAVLEDVSFKVTSGQKLGLVGPNGSGKTSILRMLVGEEPVSGGAIVRAPGLKLGYVPQLVEHNAQNRVIETVLREHGELERRLRDAERRLASAASGELSAVEQSYEAASQAYEQAGGDRVPSRAIEMLDSLGLAGRSEELVGTLSGGEKNVLSLVRALLAEPELLLLDEPANHLDFEGLAWLESFLAGYRGAVLIVSHNRYLLDRVVDEILHLEDGRVRQYTGNYTSYRTTLLREKISQGRDYVVNQRRLAQLEELVKRFEVMARRTGDAKWGKRLRARRSQLSRERAQAVEKPAEESSSMRPRVDEEASHADIALQVRGYSKAFGALVLLEDAELHIAAGERVALIGPNGSGKTTLLRDVMKHGAWDHPTIRIGPSLRVGYCAQEQEVLDNDRTVFNQIFGDGNITRDETHTLLARYMFGPDDYEKRVGSLSGGERNRLQLAKVLNKNPNFLILDEPTNHLDIPAREAIEEVLADFKGTLLLVSHDRYFLDKVAGRVVELRDRKLVSHIGSFSEYWAEQQAALRPERARATTRGRRRERVRRVNPQAEAMSREPSALDRQIADVEREKMALEKRVSEAFTRGDHREGSRIANELERKSAELERLFAQWEREQAPPSEA